MNRWTLVLLGLFVGHSAWAQKVQVPCEEFVKVMGAKMACDRIPTVSVDTAQWNAQQAKNKHQQCLVDNGEQDLPPWKRSEKCKPGSDAKPAPRSLADEEPCTLAPWKRPDGVKCD